MNPPLRSAEDRDALRAGLADGTIDAIATDHAPHAVEEKEAEFDQAPPGTIGLETALAAVLTDLVETGRAHVGRARSTPCRPRPHGSSAPPTTAARSSPAAPPTWSCSTRTAEWVGRAAVRVEEPEHRVPRADGCAAGSSTRCCAARSSSPTGRRTR